MIPEKDLGLFQETARPVGAPTPIADLLRELVRT
jgi:3-hydroxyisobutyrate dehydrogenase-like beta-hydroxyacid dehydrogenase